MSRKLKIFFAVFFIAVFVAGYPQDNAEQLDAKRKKLEEEIAYTNQLISQTRKSKQATLNELRLINRQISKRNELIATLKKEIVALDTRIESTEIGLKRLGNELSKLKKEYSGIVSFAYRHQTDYNKLIYLFSAENMNQAYQRLRYLDQISEYIRNEAKNIRQKEKNKEAELLLLGQQMEAKKMLLDTENRHISNLEREQALKDDLKKKLTKTERQLRSDLRKKEKESKKLAQKIEEIIARETERKREGTNEAYALSPEEKELSSSFAGNKGKLPWPVERGLISETFGVHPHPVLRNVKTKNNGLNFGTSKDENARAIFDGKVVSVTQISSSNIAIILRHGEFFTVYSNLDEVYIIPGDEVTIKQRIGKIHTNLKGKSELHFQVWKGKDLQDPSNWILKR